MGGKSVENHLRNCLVTTLSNELAKQLTWEGQRQTIGIKNTVFANIIIGMCVYFVISLKKLFLYYMYVSRYKFFRHYSKHVQ